MPANPFDTSWMNDSTSGSGSSIPAWLQSIIAGGAGYAMNNGPGDTTSTSSAPAPWDVDLAMANSQRGLDIGAMPFTPYDGNMVAGFSPDQFAGMDMIRNNATGNPLPGQAGSALGGFLAGGGNMAPQGSNPYMGQTTNVGTNPYAGANPFLEQNIQNTMGDMARTYNQQVAPTMAANAYQSGSFGNTGQQEMENESRNQLQQNLGRTSQNMRMQDYGMQQSLAESDITRRMNAQAADLSRSGAFSESGLNRASNDYNSAQGRFLSGLSMAPSIYNMGFTGGNALLGIGGTQRAVAGEYLGADRAAFDDAQRWPFQTGAYMTSALRGGQGGTTTSTGAAPNPWAGAAGMAGLWNIFNQPRPPG